MQTFIKSVDRDRLQFIMEGNLKGFSLDIMEKNAVVIFTLKPGDNKDKEYYLKVFNKFAFLLTSLDEGRVKELGSTPIKGIDIYARTEEASLWAADLIKSESKPTKELTKSGNQKVGLEESKDDSSHISELFGIKATNNIKVESKGNKRRSSMSYPYDLDLGYGSEQATADPKGRLSFSKSSPSRNTNIIFRSEIYDVTNDYTMSDSGGEWEFDSYNPPVKEAFTQLEISKSDYDALSSEDKELVDALNSLAFNWTHTSSTTQYFFAIISTEGKGLDVFAIAPLSTEPLTLSDYSDCSLTTINSTLYKFDASSGEPSITPLVSCTLKTFIVNDNTSTENNDGTYIPLADNVQVQRYIDPSSLNYKYRTANLPVVHTEYDEGTDTTTKTMKQVYFAIAIDATDPEIETFLVNRGAFKSVQDKYSSFLGLSTGYSSLYNDAFFEIGDYDAIVGEDFLDNTFVSAQICQWIEDSQNPGYYSRLLGFGTVYFQMRDSLTNQPITSGGWVLQPILNPFITRL